MLRELMRRRVPQIVGAYLATSWIFLEFTSWTVNQYALSPTLSDFVVTALLLLTPAVALLAWRHGTPGEDAWTRTDAAIIGLTVLVAGGILMSVFRGQELGAATTLRVLENEDGDMVERTIPKAAFRRRILIWPFDNVSGDAALDDLRFGIESALVSDVGQDLFVRARTVSSEGVYGPLRERGYTSPFAVPLALKRDLSQGTGSGYFLAGSLLPSSGDSLAAAVRVYDADTAREIMSRDYRGVDPLELVDRVSVDVRRAIGIPEWQIESSIDLPAAEINTASREALGRYGEALLAMFQDDWGAARERCREATSIDPGYALAYGMSAYASFGLGDQSAAEAAMADALAHSHRLPEPDRLYMRMMQLMWVSNDTEGAIRTGLYWAELYPDDIYAHATLAEIYTNTGAVHDQIGALRRVLALDPQATDALQSIAIAFHDSSEPDSALTYYRRVAELRPSDGKVRVAVAAVLSDEARFDEARAELERARVVAPDEPEVPSQLARLEMRQGRFAEARDHLEEAASLARAPEGQLAVARAEETYFHALGRYLELRAAYDRVVDLASRHLPPSMAIQDVPTSELIRQAAEWDESQMAFALAQLDSMRATVEAPWNLLLDVSAVYVHLDAGNARAAREAVENLRTLNEMFGEAPGRVASILRYEGRIAEIEDGDCRQAVDRYVEARDLWPRSPVTRWWLARCLTSLERWNAAEAEVNWLLARYPGYARYRLLAARLYAARGEVTEAIAELEVALDFWSEADADYRPAIEARELLRVLQALPQLAQQGGSP